MFSFHKPKVYRSSEGCCICRAKSSSSRFTDSKKYEEDSMRCFNLEFARKGEICNACVLLVKRFKRLPDTCGRHWGHVVDARSGPGMKSMTKFKKLREEHAQNASDRSKSSIPEKFSKIFKKKKTIKEKTKNDGLWENQSLPPTPESLDSDGDDTQYSRIRINRRKPRCPKKLSKVDNVSFIDENVWKVVKSCCGIFYENIQNNSCIIDIHTFKPCVAHIKTNKSVEQLRLPQPLAKSTPTPVLKKHHLFFKRQSESFPRGDIVINTTNSCANNFKTDIVRNLSATAIATVSQLPKTISNSNISAKLQALSSNGSTPTSKKNSFLHKIKTESGKIVKNSLEKMNPMRIKHADLNDIKNLVKTVDKPKFVVNKAVANQNHIGESPAGVQSTATTTTTTKFNDNSSDSGFDEDRKSASPMQDVQDKKFETHPVQTMFLASGVQIQGQQQNLVLTGNEVAAKIFQSRRQQQQSSKNAGATKIAQPSSSGSHKVRAILNQSTEGHVSLTTTKSIQTPLLLSTAANTNNSNSNASLSSPMLTVSSTSASSLNPKFILIKTKFNKNQSQQQK